MSRIRDGILFRGWLPTVLREGVGNTACVETFLFLFASIRRLHHRRFYRVFLRYFGSYFFFRTILVDGDSTGNFSADSHPHDPSFALNFSLL